MNKANIPKEINNLLTLLKDDQFKKAINYTLELSTESKEELLNSKKDLNIELSPKWFDDFFWFSLENQLNEFSNINSISTSTLGKSVEDKIPKLKNIFLNVYPYSKDNKNGVEATYFIGMTLANYYKDLEEFNLSYEILIDTAEVLRNYLKDNFDEYILEQLRKIYYFINDIILDVGQDNDSDIFTKLSEDFKLVLELSKAVFKKQKSSETKKQLVQDYLFYSDTLDLSLKSIRNLINLSEVIKLLQSDKWDSDFVFGSYLIDAYRKKGDIHLEPRSKHAEEALEETEKFVEEYLKKVNPDNSVKIKVLFKLAQIYETFHRDEKLDKVIEEAVDLIENNLLEINSENIDEIIEFLEETVVLNKHLREKTKVDKYSSYLIKLLSFLITQDQFNKYYKKWLEANLRLTYNYLLLEDERCIELSNEVIAKTEKMLKENPEHFADILSSLIPLKAVLASFYSSKDTTKARTILLETLEQINQYEEDKKFILEKARILQLLGNLAFDSQDLDESKAYLEKAFNLFSSNKEDLEDYYSSLEYCYLVLSQIALLSDDEETEIYYVEALIKLIIQYDLWLSIISNKDSLLNIGTNLKRLVTIYSKRGNDKRAAQYSEILDKLITMHRTFKLTIHGNVLKIFKKILHYIDLATSHMEELKFDEARENFFEAEKLLNKLVQDCNIAPFRTQLVISYWGIGYTYYKKQEFELAIEYLKKSLDLILKYSLNINDENILFIISNDITYLSEIFIELKEYETALEYDDLGITLLKALYNRTQNEDLLIPLAQCQADLIFIDFKLDKPDKLESEFQKYNDNIKQAIQNGASLETINALIEPISEFIQFLIEEEPESSTIYTKILLQLNNTLRPLYYDNVLNSENLKLFLLLELQSLFNQQDLEEIAERIQLIRGIIHKIKEEHAEDEFILEAEQQLKNIERLYYPNFKRGNSRKRKISASKKVQKQRRKQNRQKKKRKK